jgi:hypothetical membrane protein
MWCIKMAENETNTRQRFFALCGIFGPIIFTFLVIMGSIIRPGYSQTYNFVSDLGVGPNAIIQNINFFIFGLLSIGFALGLKGALPSTGKSIKSAVWLIIIFGLGIIGAGIFPEDYMSQVPHNLVSATAFVAIIAAQFLVWEGLKEADQSVWGRYRTFSLITGILSVVLVIALKITMLEFIAFQGAVQKIFIAVWLIWIEISALKLFSLEK